MRLQSKLLLKPNESAVDEVKRLKQELNRLRQMQWEQGVGSIRCSRVGEHGTGPSTETNMAVSSSTDPATAGDARTQDDTMLIGTSLKWSMQEDGDWV